MDGFTLEIPSFYRRVYKLADIVDVDYFVPGCPPAPNQVKDVILCGRQRGSAAQKIRGGRLRQGSVRRLQAHERRERKPNTSIALSKLSRIPSECLMEQGILCMGAATRSGCGVRCPNSDQGCRGCYGPLAEVVDQGTKFLSAIASIIDSKDPSEIEEILSSLPDFVGYAYRFGMPASKLQRSYRS